MRFHAEGGEVREDVAGLGCGFRTDVVADVRAMTEKGRFCVRVNHG